MNKLAYWECFSSLLLSSVLRFQSLCVFNLGIQTRFPPESIISFFVCEKKLKMFLQLVASPCLFHHHEETLHLNSWHHFSIQTSSSSSSSWSRNRAAQTRDLHTVCLMSLSPGRVASFLSLLSQRLWIHHLPQRGREETSGEELKWTQRWEERKGCFHSAAKEFLPAPGQQQTHRSAPQAVDRDVLDLCVCWNYNRQDLFCSLWIDTEESTNVEKEKIPPCSQVGFPSHPSYFFSLWGAVWKDK